MDVADQLGQQGFRWTVVLHGHGDPTHNRMLDQAGDYFHDTYGGEMVNLFGYLWAMNLKISALPNSKIEVKLNPSGGSPDRGSQRARRC